MAPAPSRAYPSSDEALLECTASSWEGDPKRCRWCNGELTGRQRRWCGECGNEFGRNHLWSWASNAAKRRDNYQCVVCRRDPREVYEEKLELGWVPREAHRFLILQVHHRVPVLGRHAETGCHHHLDGLETLCAHHHLERHHGTRKPTDEQLRIEAA
jgi:hypothetical protein